MRIDISFVQRILLVVMCQLCLVLAGEATPHRPRPEPMIGGIGLDASRASAALLELVVGGRRAICSGSVIGARTILTAGHCIPRAGADLNASRVTVAGRTYTVARGRVGPNDVGLLITRSRIAARKLRIKRGGFPFPLGSTVFVYGFGAPNFGELRAGLQTIVSYESWSSFIVADLDEDSAGCSGDSGGPVLLLEQSGISLAGVISRGTGRCERGAPIAVSAVSTSRNYNWIMATMKREGGQ